MEYECARLPDGRIKPPFSPPDCPFKGINPGSAVPENAKEFGKLNGDPVFLGRVYDDGCWYVGTAVPNKGHCYFINGKFELKSSDSYDVVSSHGWSVSKELRVPDHWNYQFGEEQSISQEPSVLLWFGHLDQAREHSALHRCQDWSGGNSSGIELF